MSFGEGATTMSDQSDDLSYDGEDVSSPEGPKGLREALKRAQQEAKANADAAAELNKVKRELAFRDVGLDVKKPAVQDFIKAYEGDLTEQAIREAAEVRGHLEAPAPQVPEQEVAGLDRIGAASVGAPPATPSDNQAVMQEIMTAQTTEQMNEILMKHNLLNVMQ